jgi:7-carboxy-7-deazaguanine synthase
MAVKEVIAEQTSKPYPIAEIFTSPQGEGCYVGQMQTFIRLAGCTVGKPYPKERYSTLAKLLEETGHNGKHLLPIYTEKCTLYDGREFPCDTDYRKHESLTSEKILELIPAGVDHVCITGGEPMMHDISLLITHLHGIGRTVHIETSGTIWCDLHHDVWVTVSPKTKVLRTMIDRANEIKILVDRNFVPTHSFMDLTTLAYEKPVFLQPINGEHTVNAENLKLCMKWQNKYPQFRVSVQLHKVMSLILKEEIR